MPEFDWYQATIPAPTDDVLECLSGLADGLQVGHERGHHGYAHTAILGSESFGTVARVWYGGTHEYPHAVVSGSWAKGGAEAIRASFPAHKVSRVDVREDFDGAEAYDRMQAQLLDVATRRRIKVGTAGDHLVTMKGRTLYLGSRKSDVLMRLYDKAEEIRSQLRPPTWANADAWYEARGIPEHLTRLEAQVRPHSTEAKAAFATIEPTAALGASAWVRDVWRQVGGLELTPVSISNGWRQSDDERSWNAMLACYGAMLRRRAQVHGSWACVGEQLGEDLKSSSGS